MEPRTAHDQLAVREIGRRTISATFGNIIAFAISQIMFRDAPSMPMVVPVFLALMAVRIVAHHSCLTAPWRRWNWLLLSVGGGGCNLLWGIQIAYAFAVPRPGLGGLVCALFLCAFGVGSVTNTAPSAWFQRLALGALMLPPIVAALAGYGGPHFAVLEAAFLAFCLVMGQLQTRSFWEMVAATEQVRAHAEAQRAANEQLRAEISRRLQVEVELRQAQKLEAIGRLAAGIAHEINTPVQFITDSCTFLGDGLRDVIAGLGEYRELLAALADQRITSAEALARATRIDADRDLAYLVEQLEPANERSLDGLQRVARIVRATKDFARASSVKVPTDLNASLESTLVICRHETSAVADIVTELGELPLVMANAGEINQVFLIVIINAVHAIRELVEHSHRRGTISIKTWAQDAWVQIAITDTGAGIAPDVLDKIFEPFFTTKEVGEGTGQGLAIARSIVVGKHGGRLDVRSHVGSGSTFTIALPI